MEADTLTYRGGLLVVTTPARLRLDEDGPVEITLSAAPDTPDFRMSLPPTPTRQAFDVWGDHVRILRAPGDEEYSFLGGSMRITFPPG